MNYQITAFNELEVDKPTTKIMPFFPRSPVPSFQLTEHEAKIMHNVFVKCIFIPVPCVPVSMHGFSRGGITFLGELTVTALQAVISG